MRFLVDRGPLYAAFVEHPETDACREILQALQPQQSPYGEILGIVPGFYVAQMHVRLCDPALVDPPLKHDLVRKITKELDKFGQLRIAYLGSYQLDAGLDAMSAERFYTANEDEAYRYWTVKSEKGERVVTFEKNRFRAFPELPVQTPVEFLRDLKAFAFRSRPGRAWSG